MRESNEFSEERRYGSTSDLNRLLELAEVLQMSLEHSGRRVVIVRLFEGMTVLVAFGLGAVVGFGSWGSINSGARIGLALIPIVIGTAVAVQFHLMVSPAALRRKNADRRALVDVLKLLRETIGVISSNEQWSPLERAEFQIRLARFDIEE